MTGPAPGPLAGLRVIELGTLLAGPFCGQLLGDFGAEVIKVEPPGQGDPRRSTASRCGGRSSPATRKRSRSTCASPKARKS